MKRFTVRNEPFICKVCGHENPPAPKTCRNHCRACLHSLHVDKNPGDRANMCQGVLEPIGIDITGGLPSSIQFRCQKCGTTGVNKIAEDDDRGKVIEIVEKNAQ